VAGTDILRFRPRFDGEGGQFSSHRSSLLPTVAGITSEYKNMHEQCDRGTRLIQENDLGGSGL